MMDDKLLLFLQNASLRTFTCGYEILGNNIWPSQNPEPYYKILYFRERFFLFSQQQLSEVKIKIHTYRSITLNAKSTLRK